ncbi:MAG: ADOP family duplicated permease [Bryobacterales bacterium]|nr:ADOP family duplicated permease [Bryobacterales bacterium]
MTEIFRWWWRTVRRQSLLSGLAIGTLAAGIAFALAVFSIVDQVLLRPLPFPEPDRLAIAWSETGSSQEAMISIPDYLDLRARLRGFDHFATHMANGMEAQGKCVIGEHADVLAVPCAGVSSNFFSALGVKPFLGRDFTEAHEKPANAKVVILSYRFWQRQYRGDPAIIGRPIRVDGAAVTVIGVMPPAVDLPEHSAIWTPAPFDDFFRSEKARGLRYVHPFGRLRPGVSFQAAGNEIRALMSTLPRPPAGERLPWPSTLLPLHEALVRDTRTGLRVLLAASLVLLLILTSNLVNLILTTTLHRRREFAVRAACGATPAGIRRQLLAECLLVALVSGALGAALAYAVLPLLIRSAPVDLFRLGQVSIRLPSLLFALLISLSIGLLSGIAPVLTTHRARLADILKEGGRSGRHGSRRTAASLVVFQVALASLLLPAALSMLLDFRRLRMVDPGFDPGNAVAMTLGGDLETRPDLPQLIERILDRIRQIPSVEAVSVSIGALPLRGWRSDLRFRPERDSTADPSAVYTAHHHLVSREYFAALGIPLLAGRTFLPEEMQRGGPVVIVNQELADRFFHGRDAIGQRIRPENRGPREIVGIVRNVLSRGLDQPPYPAIYSPSLPAWDLIVRSRTKPSALVPSIRAAIEIVAAGLVVFDVAIMDEVVRSSLTRQRVWTIALTTFSLLSLVFALAGVYGLVSYSVRHRLPEFGLRAALGARPRDQFLAVVGPALALTITGVTIGFAAYLVLAPKPDPWLLPGAAVLILASGLLATVTPARWAMEADPATLLRID